MSRSASVLEASIRSSRSPWSEQLVDPRARCHAEGSRPRPSVLRSSASPRLHGADHRGELASGISPRTGPSVSWITQRPEPAFSCTAGGWPAERSSKRPGCRGPGRGAPPSRNPRPSPDAAGSCWRPAGRTAAGSALSRPPKAPESSSARGCPPVRPSRRRRRRRPEAFDALRRERRDHEVTGEGRGAGRAHHGLGVPAGRRKLGHPSLLAGFVPAGRRASTRPRRRRPRAGSGGTTPQDDQADREDHHHDPIPACRRAGGAGPPTPPRPRSESTTDQGSVRGLSTRLR